MRRGAIMLITVTLLVGLIWAARPAISQEPLPTPRGQLGGREPLALTAVLPAPTALPTSIATASPSAPGTPAATPTAAVVDVAASPVSTP